MRAAVAAAALLGAIAIVFAAIGFLVVALYLYLLAMALTPWLAALIVGLVLLGLAGLALGAVRIGAAGPGRRRGRSARWRRGGVFSFADLGNRAARETAAAAEDHPYGAASAAFLAGLALGGSSEMQDLVKTALRASVSNAAN